ncbi:MAG TPA: M56 family metallopeptidase [Terracidiphilus sp.]|nr:M56 family metallopeptidase [Terracidiphilus sp.]
MTIPAFWNENWMAGLVNHLWQSTVVLGIAWLLSTALRKNSARTRYWLWMAASVKFLLPFAFFVDAGEWIHSLIAAPAVSISMPAAAAVMQQIAQPFPDFEFINTSVPAHAQHATIVPVLLLAVWMCGVVVVVARWAGGWLRIHTAMRTAEPLELVATEVRAFSTAAQMEPGIFGIFRPVLLLPQGVLTRLSPAQLSAVIAHEMCHVRRRDNLIFALHMIVEAVFWFYPAVWWIGSRLIDERERACDEAVIQKGGSAETYAEGILSVCKFCVESPLACVSGVTGADLKQRVMRIMKGNVAQELDLSRRLMLGVFAFAALAAPFAVGLMHSARIRAQLVKARGSLPSFEVATIKPSHFLTNNNFFNIGIRPAEFTTQNLSLARLLRVAYSVKSDSQIQNLPRWADTERFEIDARIPDAEVAKMGNLSPDQRFEEYQLMIQSLLADRFKLKVSTQMKELPIYALVVDRGGEKMESVAVLRDPRKQRAGEVRLFERKGELTASAISTARLCQWLSGTPEAASRPVIDDTGLKGRYTFTLRWTPLATFAPRESDNNGGQEPAGALAIQSSGPSLFTAVENQLGLKLVAKRAPVEVLVIDKLEQPSPH